MVIFVGLQAKPDRDGSGQTMKMIVLPKKVIIWDKYLCINVTGAMKLNS